MNPRAFKSAEGMLAFMTSQQAKGHVWHVLVLHDGACSPSRCVCTPWFEVRPGTADNFIEGARLERAWIEESSS